MTPESTPPGGGEPAWAASTPPDFPDTGAVQRFAFPTVTPNSPSRTRITGPYACLSRDPDATDHSYANYAQSTMPGTSTAASGGGQHTPKPSWMQRLKAAAKALKREVLAVYYAMQHPQTPFLAKALAFCVLAYALSPLDLIPDFIPVLGLLDDLILLPLMIGAAIALIPKDVMAECRLRAVSEPLRLARSWPMAVVIFAMWVATLEWLCWVLIRTYGTPFMRQYLPYGMLALGLGCGAGFGFWLAGAVRKERRKRRKAEAAAVMGAGAESEPAAVAAAGVTEPLLSGGAEAEADAEADGEEEEHQEQTACQQAENAECEVEEGRPEPGADADADLEAGGLPASVPDCMQPDVVMSVGAPAAAQRQQQQQQQQQKQQDQYLEAAPQASGQPGKGRGRGRGKVAPAGGKAADGSSVRAAGDEAV